jgi:hypothetical protein
MMLLTIYIPSRDDMGKSITHVYIITPEDMALELLVSVVIGLTLRAFLNQHMNEGGRCLTAVVTQLVLLHHLLCVDTTPGAWYYVSFVCMQGAALVTLCREWGHCYLTSI